jgi:hypothetical protein
MLNPNVPITGNTHPPRRLLGLAVLLATLGGGYALAHHEVMPASLFVRLAPDADASEDEVEVEADEPRIPTTAEILAHIDEVAARHKVPPKLVAAIVAAESSFNPRAVSNRGAQGLMQLMPATAARLDVQDSFDMAENLDGGVRHLRVLMDRFKGDLPLVLAAYNAGDRAVLNYRGVPPYPQTRKYVIRVLRRYDPVAARAAAARIYGRPHTVVAQPSASQVASLNWPPPPPRPIALGPWRESVAPRTDPTPSSPSPSALPLEHGTNSP